MEQRATATNRPALARPQARGRLPAARGRRRHPDHSADARPREHSADATLLERDGRRTMERIGGELDQPGPTASARIAKLNRSRLLARLSRFCPGNVENVAPQVGFEPTTLRLTGGKSAASGALLDLAARWRIVHPRLRNQSIQHFRSMPAFAAVCRPWWHPKGKKRARRGTSGMRRRQRGPFIADGSRGERPATRFASAGHEPSRNALTAARTTLARRPSYCARQFRASGTARRACMRAPRPPTNERCPSDSSCACAC
jgi:hypothetical protein